MAAKGGSGDAVPDAALPGGSLPTAARKSFREIFACNEEKQYKKAIKAADAVLKAVPGHGETLSMKGLVLHNLGRKDEALALAKDGLKANVKCVPRGLQRWDMAALMAHGGCYQPSPCSLCVRWCCSC